MQRAQLIFIPAPGLSHLVSTVEIAKLLINADARLSVTVLTVRLPNDNVVDKYVSKMSSGSDPQSRLSFMELSDEEDKPSDSKTFRMFDLLERQVVRVKEIAGNLMKSSPVAGLVLDMFCTRFIDVAEELGLYSYIYFTSSACSLSVFSQLASLRFEQNQNLKQFKNTNTEMSVPCLSVPLPTRLLPYVFVSDNPIGALFLDHFKRFPDAKGMMINTFYELESYAIESLSDGKFPKIYPVGPIVSVNNQNDSHGSTRSADSADEVTKWLDSQPESSVVFLCFGTMGSFNDAQVKEIATALERSNHRFLWSLRKPGATGSTNFPTEYEDFQEVMPEGFIERTKGVGKLIGWAPQTQVLSHPAVGGFVSHCGWNSTLESLWCGVPIATFPLYAEQQLNAFQLVVELGLAEKIRLDFQKLFTAESGEQEIVGADEIEAGIRRLMAEDHGGVRQKVKEMQKSCRKAHAAGGSSHTSINQFIEDALKNIP